MQSLQARLLPTPSVQFRGAPKDKRAMWDAHETIKGRWRIDGKKFVLGNEKRIPHAWGVAVSHGRYPMKGDDIKRFFKEFVRIYNGHGGQLVNEPYIWQGDLVRSPAGFDEL